MPEPKEHGLYICGGLNEECSLGSSRWAGQRLAQRPPLGRRVNSMYVSFPDILVPSAVPTNWHEVRLVQPSFQVSERLNYPLLSCLSPSGAGRSPHVPYNPLAHAWLPYCKVALPTLRLLSHGADFQASFSLPFSSPDQLSFHSLPVLGSSSES